MDRAKTIFGNAIASADYRKACRQKEKFLKKYGDDSARNLRPLPHLHGHRLGGPRAGV